MRNAGAVSIRKASTAIGVGLLEMALEAEGSKGCSPFLCVEPVWLEPVFERFDAERVLRMGRSAQDGEAGVAVGSVEWSTIAVFPSDEDLVGIRWMETAMRALSVLAGPFAFELVGNADGVVVRFGVPCGEVAGFKASLCGHFPALVLREVGEPFPAGAPAAVEELVPVGPYHRTLSLLGQEGASPLALATSVLTALPPEALGCLQILLQPANPAHDWHYNIENLLSAEERAINLAQLGGLSSQFAYDAELPPLLEPTAKEKVRADVGFFATIGRYAVWGAEVEAFVQGMRVATGMVRFGNRSWRRLTHQALVAGLGEGAVASLVSGRVSHRPGLMLTSQEVATFVHVPNATMLRLLRPIAQRDGLPWSPVVDTDDSQSAELGINTFVGEAQPVATSLSVRLRHTYVVGATGSEKSKLLERTAVDDAYRSLGFCVVDPHGDLCLDILSRLPEERLADLVYLSFGERGLVPVWNPFASPVQPGKLADDVTRAFLAQTASRGARMEHNFRMLSYVVCRLGGTLNDFAELVERTSRGEDLRRQALDAISNQQVRRFLTAELPSYSAGDVRSVTNKLSPLLLDDQLGVMFSQRENRLDPSEWMSEGRIVLVNLASSHIGADHARVVGSLLVSLIYRAALSRTDIAPEDRRPFLLYIDEFQQLQAATLSELLSEGRKYAIGTVLAHQERGQLSKQLGQALGNCATKIIFRPTEDDLLHCRKILGERVAAEDLRHLGVGRAYLASGTQVATLQTELTTRPRLRNPRAAASEYARAHYRSITEATAPTTRRPRIYDTFGED